MTKSPWSKLVLGAIWTLGLALGAARGDTFEITGTHLNGKPLDLSKLEEQFVVTVVKASFQFDTNIMIASDNRNTLDQNIVNRNILIGLRVFGDKKVTEKKSPTEGSLLKFTLEVADVGKRPDDQATSNTVILLFRRANSTVVTAVVPFVTLSDDGKFEHRLRLAIPEEADVIQPPVLLDCVEYCPMGINGTHCPRGVHRRWRR
jgi:hypothetical protein